MARTRYVLGRRLGSGGMGDVFEATAHGLGAFARKVAVKKMRADLASSREVQSSFFDEAMIACELHHANIVSIVDFGSVEDVPFHVFELVEGLNLRDLRLALVKHGRAVGEELALSIGSYVAHALAYAHALTDKNGAPRKIVHRDVSPQNVLISWAGDVKLADFGVASATKRSQKTATGFIKGNLDYMAPEQAGGDDVDPRADVFALGCVLHWFLRGASPIGAAGALGASIAGTDPPIDDGLSADLASLLREATRASRKKRLPDMNTFAKAIARALLDRGVSDPRAVVLEQLAIARGGAAAPKAVLEDLFAPAIVLTGIDAGGMRNFTAVTATEAEDSTSSTSSTPHGDLEEKRDLRDERLEVGTTLGGLELVEVISSGGFSVVYRGEHALLGRAYAVKVLRARADSEKNRKRLEREARALASVAHPNIVTIHDFGHTASGRPYLITELIDGPTLRQHVTRIGPLPIEVLVSIGVQLANALAQIHALSLVHRDLKPTNVILALTSPPLVKLIDFGIARLAALAADESQLTSTDEILGTPAFMPPEQIHDPSSAEPRSDLYALGCLLYFLAEGRPLFEGSRDAVLRHQIDSPPPGSSLQPRLNPLLQRLLAKRPEDRPNSAAEVALALEQIHRDAATTLLLPAAAVAPLIERSGDRWVRPVWGATLLIAGTVAAGVAYRVSTVSSEEVALTPALTAGSSTVAARVQVLPREVEQETPDEPAPVESAPAAVRPRSSRRASTRATNASSGVASTLELELSRRGLSLADLSHYPGIDRSEDPPELLAAIDRAPAPKKLLLERLDAAGAMIAACATKRCGGELEKLESDYLELRIAVTRSKPAQEETRRLLRATAELLRGTRKLSTTSTTE